MTIELVGLVCLLLLIAPFVLGAIAYFVVKMGTIGYFKAIQQSQGESDADRTGKTST